jgi:hypothetical protein
MKFRRAGVRRALVESVLSLRVSDAVLQDMMNVLGPVEELEMPAYEATSEIYGSCRMLLASLEREMLEKLVVGYGCNFWEELQPLRHIRPVNGGPGYSKELVEMLRGLNFELD